jgi:hypothetical protein
MKTCKKCGETKSKAEFYVKREAADGLAPQCKACCKAYQHERQEKNHGVRSMPESTARAMALLKSHGIPVQTGSQANMPWKDLAVYGCIPVEAKTAHAITRKNGSEHYSFGFTRAQVEAKREGFIILIAQGKRERVFVVPAADPVFEISGQKLIVTLYAQWTRSKNSAAQRLARYENAFHLISESMANTLEGPRQAVKPPSKRFVIDSDKKTYQNLTRQLRFEI